MVETGTASIASEVSAAPMGKFTMFDDVVHLYDVLGVNSAGDKLRFRWNGRPYAVPKGAIMPTSAVWQAQQKGTLIVTREGADACGVFGIAAQGLKDTDISREYEENAPKTVPAGALDGLEEVWPHKVIVASDSTNMSWPTDEHTVARAAISAVCNEIRDLLLSKNQQYGNSALEPVRFFSKADTVEQLLVRIDDKLSRLQQGGDDTEDAELDLLGYFVMLRIARQQRGRGNGAGEAVASAMMRRR